MSESYKAAKEAFVSGMTGSTMTHINLISSVAWSSIALLSVIQTRIHVPHPLVFWIEWTTLVIPLLLSLTYFASNPILLNVIIIIPTFILINLPYRETGTFLPSNSPLPEKSLNPVKKPISITPLPALTTYRSHMLLMTFLSILAVDFPLFPRALAKCEVFGVSVMDLGVGSFVFSQGIVSAIPIIKDDQYLRRAVLPSFLSALRKTLPLTILGLVRVLLVKSTDYPEHVTEYGVHWNFFLTMALLPAFEVLLHPLIRDVPISWVGGIFAIVHQLALTFIGLETYVLVAPRSGLISSNKEGIVSLLGYMSIHLLGLSMGTVIVPPSPAFLRKRRKENKLYAKESSLDHPDSDADSESGSAINAKTLRSNSPRQLDKTLSELVAYAVIWWTVLALSIFAFGNVSRVMANMPYVFWIAAYNTSFLCGYIFLDLWLFPSLPVKPKFKSHIATYAKEVRLFTPVSGIQSVLLAAINRNGMLLFLLANVATGMINLSMKTMYMPDSTAMLVLTGYILGICWIAWLLRRRSYKAW